MKSSALLALSTLFLGSTAASEYVTGGNPVRTVHKLVSFGCSFSDTGNVYKLTNGAWPLAVNYNGHFSNGKMWPEYVADMLDVTFINEAYGGATTDNAFVQGYTGANSDVPVPSIKEQIGHYLDTNPPHINEAVYALFPCGNEFFFNQTVTGEQVAQSLAGVADQLVKRAQSAEIRTFFAGLGTSFNAALTPTLRKQFPALKIPVVDIYSLYEKILVKMFKESVKPCWDMTGTATCADPKQYLFWDLFHPTTEAHKQIAAAFLVTLRKLL
ncbi:hypothetical protein HK104_009853 [Borealophlyctis nickersoniae]|nr:hypothetical protein HK104_009853 [Borealophlyctis nickersoniae]